LVQDTATIATSKHFMGDQEFPNYLNE
jgi:hypothetical protein